MSHSPRPELLPAVEDQLPCEVAAHMTTYSAPQNSTAKGKKTKTKKAPAKETRVKEFTHAFAPTHTNYIEFLQKILNKHHLQYTVSIETVFACTVQVPPLR